MLSASTVSLFSEALGIHYQVLGTLTPRLGTTDRQAIVKGQLFNSCICISYLHIFVFVGNVSLHLAYPSEPLG